MIKKRKSIIFLASLLISIILPTNVYAKDPETIGDLRKIYNNYVAEKKAYDNKSEQAKREIELKKAEEQKANEELSKAEDDEETAKLKIIESNEKIDENKIESEKILVYSQQIKNQNAYVEYATGASSMTEMIMRIEAAKQITDYIQTVLDNLEQEIKINEELKIELQEKQKQLALQIANYQETIKKLYSDIEEYDEFSLSIDDKVAVAKAELDAKLKLCKENIGRNDDSVKLSDCSKIPTNGSWLKPLVSGVVTSPMGYRTHPVTGQKYKFHDGIDIGVSEGTPIYAAAAGEVKATVARSSCGGNRLYINVIVNGKQYTTYYYHLLSFNVKVGDIVDQNTIIGYVGGYSTSTAYGGYDGCTTGAHLHFGVQNGFYNGGIYSSNVIVPPGFNNVAGYRFSSRYDYYGTR